MGCRGGPGGRIRLWRVYGLLTSDADRNANTVTYPPDGGYQTSTTGTARSVGEHVKGCCQFHLLLPVLVVGLLIRPLGEPWA